MGDVASARKLASIVAIDVAGYSRRTEADEGAAIRAVAALRERIAKAVTAHGGRVFNTAGDGFMLEFPTASGALAAAEEIAAAGDPPVRVGVHLGEVSITESGDLLGHGVNVAARIQQMASPGAVLASGDVKRAIRGPLGERLRPQGSVKLDKMSETLPVFALAPAEGGKAKGRRLDLRSPAIIAVAALVLALVGLSLWLSRSAWLGGPPRDVRIEVRSFAVPGGEPKLRDFADGLADQVSGVLNANGMQTVSRASVSGGTGPATGAAGADFILDGAIRSDGRTLSVTAHVDEAHDQVLLWSGELAQPLSHALPLQQAAAAKIAAVLRCAVQARRARLGSADEDTLSIYLRACDYDSSIDLGSLQHVLELDREVASRAPKFSRGHSDLAFMLEYASQWLPPSQTADLRREARAEADKALALDPKSGDAYVVEEALLAPGQKLQREALLRRGVSVDPASIGANWRYSGFLSETGQLQEALVFAEKAAALDPLSPTRATSAAESLARLGRYDAADEVLQHMRLAWPDAPDTGGAGFTIDLWAGRFDAAVARLDQDVEPAKSMGEGARVMWRRLVLALKSRDPKLREAQRKFLTSPAITDPLSLSFAVENLTQLGFIDDAFAQAYKLHGRQAWLNPAFLFNPSTAAMRHDPRFMKLAASMGLVDYWRSTGKWPDFCSEPRLPYDCKTEAWKAAGPRRD